MCVIGVLRFGADGGAGSCWAGKVVDGQCAAGDESTASNGNVEAFEIGMIFEQFHGGGSLADDHLSIVEGVDESGFFLLDDPLGVGFSVSEGGWAFDDRTAVIANGDFLDEGCVIGHDDVSGDVEQLGGERQGLREVPGGMGDDPTSAVGIAQAEQRVHGASHFESAHLLKVLAFEPDIGVGLSVH